MKEKKDYEKTIFSLTKEQHEFLKQYAFDKRQSMSSVVRDYVQSLIPKKDGE